jgi:aldose 1-epimerase
MFVISPIIKENKKSYIELKSANNATKAVISLTEGGRLQALQFDKIDVVKEPIGQKYEDSFAAAILFPFANRIKNGNYSFNNTVYQFECNEKGNNNALHGLVYNKQFLVIDQQIQTNLCSITLFYQEKERSIGFPFLYDMTLKYTLEEEHISIAVQVKNTDITSFPFTLGWHPYFVSTDLYHSFLSFKSQQKVQFDANLITDTIIELEAENPCQIKNKGFDDCYVLREGSVEFSTPTHSILLNSDAKENYLQVYTPKDKQVIALEPMSGISDSFNNKKGLQILDSNAGYSVQWDVHFIKKGSKNE